MKKMVVVAVLAVMLSGCAALQTVSDFVCNPTAEQQQTAAQMLTALDAAQTFAAGFYPVAGVVKASAVLQTIKAGGCFLVSELAEAFKAVDAANTAKLQAQMKLLPTGAAALPEYAALRRLMK